MDDRDDFVSTLPRYPAQPGADDRPVSRPTVADQIAWAAWGLKLLGVAFLAAGGCAHWLWVVVLVLVAAGTAVGLLLQHVCEPADRR
jgi:hypothetical protein